MEYLFIYGSLTTTEGHPMHNFLRGYCDFMGKATIGGILIHSGSGSGLVPSGDPNERVEGELFRIHEGAGEALFQGLDNYEGCGDASPEPHEFFR